MDQSIAAYEVPAAPLALCRADLAIAGKLGTFDPSDNSDVRGLLSLIAFISGSGVLAEWMVNGNSVGGFEFSWLRIVGEMGWRLGIRFCRRAMYRLGSLLTFIRLLPTDRSRIKRIGIR